MKKSKLTILLVLVSTLCMLHVEVSHAALLYSQSANQVVSLDQSFTIEWFLDTQGQSINTADISISFSSETLEVLDASAGSSGLNLWIQTPEFDNEAGKISLIGGTAGGFNTSKFPLFRTTFRAKELGQAQITMDESSKVLLSDGLGTQLQLSFARLNFQVVQSKPTDIIFSETHADENVWYKENFVRVKINPQPEASYSYSFSSNVEIFPDQVVDNVTEVLSFDNLPDGIYYLKLNSLTNPGVWEEVGIRRFMIDQTSPDPFVPVVASDPSVLNGAPFVSFATTDKVSGVSRYAVKVGILGVWVETEQTYYVLPQFRLSDQIQVKAIDSAGNEQVAATEIMVDGKFNFSKLLLWIILLGSVIVVYKLFRKLMKRLEIPKNPHET